MLSRNKKIIVTLVICLLLLGGGFTVFAVYKKIPTIEYSSIVVERKDLFQSVSETGSVNSEIEISYGWETTGQVVHILKRVGDTVEKGDVIAELDDAQRVSRLREAQSLISVARAKLNAEYAGPSDEGKRKAAVSIDEASALLEQAKAELQKITAESEQSINTAKRTLEDAENNLRLVEGGEDSQLVNDAYEDVLNTLKIVAARLNEGLIEADRILGVDNTFVNTDFSIALGFRNRSQVDVAKRSYLSAKAIVNSVVAEIYPLHFLSSHDDIDQGVVEATSGIIAVQQLLFDTQALLAVTDPVGGLSQTELDTMKTNITGVLTNLNNVSVLLSNDKQAIVSARNSFFSYTIARDKASDALQTTQLQASAAKAIAQANIKSLEARRAEAQAAYDDLVAPPRTVDVAALRADIERYEANALALQDDVKKAKLIALESGILSFLDVDVGETVGVGQHVATIISPQLSIDVDISESDIAKISLGDDVSITLDAFQDTLIFKGVVADIEPAQTEISGVIYYNTDILFTEGDLTAVRPGMTANITVFTDQKEDTLVVPQRAVLTRDTASFVRVLVDKQKGKFEERPVLLGLRGDNGEVEITQGLVEGEEIITFLKDSL